jgi:hypothetical protein
MTPLDRKVQDAIDAARSAIAMSFAALPPAAALALAKDLLALALDSLEHAQTENNLPPTN